MNVKQMKGNLMLILTAIIWGAAFVAQDAGMDFIGPFTFTAARMYLGSFSLLPLVFYLHIKDKKNATSSSVKALFTSYELMGGLICGVVLFLASSLQQIGISLYSEAEAVAGKSGFITALYIVVVPIMGIFLKKKTNIFTWVSVVLATLGLYFICVKGKFSVSLADILLFGCALIFAVHIMVVDYYSPKVNGVKLSAVQFFTAGTLALIFSLMTEKITISGLRGAAVPVLYAGLLSCTVAYTLQVVAQKYTQPAVASVLMSLESVFAAITGMLFGERLASQEIFGCILMFVAVLLAQTNSDVLFKKIKVLTENIKKGINIGKKRFCFKKH